MSKKETRLTVDSPWEHITVIYQVFRGCLITSVNATT